MMNHNSTQEQVHGDTEWTRGCHIFLSKSRHVTSNLLYDHKLAPILLIELKKSGSTYAQYKIIYTIYTK